MAHAINVGNGHISSQCPNHDPSTIRARPTSNFACASSTKAWNVDTCANIHITLILASIQKSRAYNGNDALHVGNGKGLHILQIGSTKIYSPHKTFTLSNILHVPEITRNLLSIKIFVMIMMRFWNSTQLFFILKDGFTYYAAY